MLFRSGDVVADDAVGGICPDRSFRSVLPHGGRQLSWFYRLVRHRGRPKTRDETWGIRQRKVWDGETTFTQVQITRRWRDPTPAINYYKATIAQVTEIVFGVKIRALRLP